MQITNEEISIFVANFHEAINLVVTVVVVVSLMCGFTAVTVTALVNESLRFSAGQQSGTRHTRFPTFSYPSALGWVHQFPIWPLQQILGRDPAPSTGSLDVRPLWGDQMCFHRAQSG